MPYHYQIDDDIFDIESKPDVFTDAQFYPAQNKLIVSIIQDSEMLVENNDRTFSTESQQVIIDRIRKVNPRLQDTTIVIENLKRVPNYQQWQNHLKNVLDIQNHQIDDFPIDDAEYSLIGWLHRLGVGNQDANGQHQFDAPINNFMNAKHELYSNDKERFYSSMQDYNNSKITSKLVETLNSNSQEHINSQIPKPYQNKLIMNDVAGQYYPIKKTDPVYDPNSLLKHCGLTLGYNSTNYDLTMLALIISNIPMEVFNYVYTKQYIAPDSIKKLNEALNAKYIRRQYNDSLFSPQYINNMWQFLRSDPNNNQYAMARNIKEAWLSTNRFLDVSKFNEHQRKVSLKRISGMMGLQIKESENLGDDNSTVDTLDNLAELVAYNVSDVYNTKLLFDDSVYQDGFQLKQSLIEHYHGVVYQQSRTKDNIQNSTIDPNGQEVFNYGRKAEVNPLKLRSRRLCADDSSAKFIANVISPFEKLEDIPAIDLTYPAKDVLEEIKVQAKDPDNPYHNREIRNQPYDVLEDTKDWVYGRGAYAGTGIYPDGANLGPNGKKEFEKIYNFYDAFRGSNINDDLSGNATHHRYPNDVSDKVIPYLDRWNKEHPDRQFVDEQGKAQAAPDINVKETMQKFPTNVFYMDGHDQKTSSIANLSIGGIHGAEIKLNDYNEELKRKQAWDGILSQITDQYDSLEDAYLNHKDDTFELFYEAKPLKIRKFFMSKSTGKKAYLKQYKMKDLFHLDSSSKIEKLRKEYTYVSVGQASHEDFSSYYPTLLTMLAVFRDPDDGSDAYADLYHERLALKAKLKTLKFGSPEYKQVNLEQNLRKLLLNSASGAGDASFESNIKMNNATISMRIIGQLFAWRIGQAEANYGARVPSTNTDGLYVMGIDPKVNDQVLFKTVDPMLINIDPEIVDRFVSKDANNRVEVDDNEIQEAKGGTLTSWQGPSPQNNLSHPAICDRVLAMYLAFKPSGENPTSPCDQPFDREYASQMMRKILTDGGSFTANHIYKLKLLQWVLASGISTHRHNFLKRFEVQPEVDGQINDKLIQAKSSQTDITGEPEPMSGFQIPRTNRVFMIKRPAIGETYNTVQIITKRKIPAATQRKREKQGIDPITGEESMEDRRLMACYVGDDMINEFHSSNQAIVTAKVTDMPENEPIYIFNQALDYVTPKQYNQIIGKLDINAYLDIVESKFNNSWKN